LLVASTYLRTRLFLTGKILFLFTKQEMVETRDTTIALASLPCGYAVYRVTIGSESCFQAAHRGDSRIGDAVRFLREATYKQGALPSDRSVVVAAIADEAKAR